MRLIEEPFCVEGILGSISQGKIFLIPEQPSWLYSSTLHLHYIYSHSLLKELEKDTTDKVASHFRAIDDVLYESENYPEQKARAGGGGKKPPLGQGADTASQQRSVRLPDSPSLSKELQQECTLWRKAFPHLR